MRKEYQEIQFAANILLSLEQTCMREIDRQQTKFETYQKSRIILEKAMEKQRKLDIHLEEADDE